MSFDYLNPSGLLLFLNLRPSQGTDDLNRYGKFPTPSRRIQGTALRAPLQITNSEVDFYLPPGYYELGVENSAGRTAVSMLLHCTIH